MEVVFPKLNWLWGYLSSEPMETCTLPPDIHLIDCDTLYSLTLFQSLHIVWYEFGTGDPARYACAFVKLGPIVAVLAVLFFWGCIWCIALTAEWAVEPEEEEAAVAPL